MSKAELEKWAEDEFWPAYKKLCLTPYRTKWTGGAKGECTTAIIKLNPSRELRERMLAGVEKQRAFRQALFEHCGQDRGAYERKGRPHKICATRNGKTWVNNMGWLDEVPVFKQNEGGQEAEYASETCRCGNPATTVQGLCADCYTRALGKLDHQQEWLRKMGLERRPGESNEDYNRRCREYTHQKLAHVAPAHILSRDSEYDYVPGEDG